MCIRLICVCFLPCVCACVQTPEKINFIRRIGLRTAETSCFFLVFPIQQELHTIVHPVCVCVCVFHPKFSFWGLLLPGKFVFIRMPPHMRNLAEKLCSWESIHLCCVWACFFDRPHAVSSLRPIMSSQVVCFVCNLPILTHQVNNEQSSSTPLGIELDELPAKKKGKKKLIFSLPVVVVVVLTMSFLLSHRWDLFGKAATVSMSSCVTSKDPMPWRPYVPGSAVAIPPLNSEPSVRPGNF